MFDIKSHLPKVQRALDDLGYDFTRFNVGDFVGHIAARQQRDILIHEAELTAPIFGAWMPAEGADYIFLDPRIHPVQYLHTLIHELAHIILGHRGFDLVDILGADVAAALGIRPLSGHLRAPCHIRDNNDDGEAEPFAGLHVELYRVTYGNGQLTTYVRLYNGGSQAMWITPNHITLALGYSENPVGVPVPAEGMTAFDLLQGRKWKGRSYWHGKGNRSQLYDWECGYLLSPLNRNGYSLTQKAIPSAHCSQPPTIHAQNCIADR